MKSQQAATGIVADDPLRAFSIGDSIHFDSVILRESDATSIPDTVKNWEFFQGAVLGLVLCGDGFSEMVGTAVIIAPGLAVTATHNFAPCAELLKEGAIVPYCIGIRDRSAELWRINAASTAADDDIALLAITANSPLPDNRTYYRLGVTTRTPSIGEKLHIFGFRETSGDAQDKTEDMSFYAGMYASSGIVSSVFPYGRDKILLPYPSIELNCGSLGGMSGGAVLDRRGLLMGVVSRGLDSMTRDGPTYASWLFTALGRSIRLEWPRGLYQNPVTPMSLDRRLLFIDRPESIRILEEGGMEYAFWTE